MIWNGNFGFQAWLEKSFGAGFHDTGSVVVHGVELAGRRGHRWARTGRYGAERRSHLLRFRGWRWAVGFCALAGSASTWLARNRWKAFPVWSRLIP